MLKFYGLFVQKQEGYFMFKIYKKPTTTGIFIHTPFYNPYAKKIAPFNAYIHDLMTTYIHTT